MIHPVITTFPQALNLETHPPLNSSQAYFYQGGGTLFMDLLVAFVITIALITLISIRYRISPFFTLIGGSILFGLLAG